MNVYFDETNKYTCRGFLQISITLTPTMVHALHWGSRLLTLMVCQKYCNWPESKWQDPLLAIHVMFSSEKLLRLMQIKHQTCNLSASPHNSVRSLISCQNETRRFLRWGQLSSDNVTGGERHCVSDHGLCGWDVDWRRAQIDQHSFIVTIRIDRRKSKSIQSDNLVN